MSRVCSLCEIEQPLENFHKSSTGRLGRRSACKECRSVARKPSYRKHRNKAIAYADARRRETLDYIRGHKARPCADCGNEYPYYVMNFHHVIEPKLFALSSHKVYGMSRSRIDAEIAKCVILCANCHLLRHGGDTSGIPDQLVLAGAE